MCPESIEFRLTFGRRNRSILTLDLPPQFKCGEALIIADEAMAGFEGIFLARSGKNPVVALLGIMDRQARVEVGQDAVEPLR